jgi:hypothetical protein
MNKIDLIGQKFNRWTIISEPFLQKSHHPLISCKCDCGTVKNVYLTHLTRGLSKSCGCLKKELAGQQRIIHGMTKTREFKIWMKMRQRCLNSSDHAFKDYGGRGITVCDRWINSFENFYADMGDSPEGMSIDRIDNNKGYSPDNCKWSTDKEQSRNRRNNHMITFNEKTQCLTDWSSELGIKHHTLCVRLNKLNWSIEKALTTPLSRGIKC